MNSGDWEYPGRTPTDWKKSTFYEVLSLPVNASKSEILKSYRKVVATVHPDMHPRCDNNDKLCTCTACEKNKDMGEACRFLAFAKGVLVSSRRAYDVYLQRRKNEAEDEGLFCLVLGTQAGFL